MTTEEFSNAFDTLLNSYSNVAGFGDAYSKYDVTLDEYEKSFFLTEAQNQIIVELYSGRNEKQSSFEKTEELRANLKNLIKTVTLEASTDSYSKLSEDSKFFKLPSDVLMTKVLGVVMVILLQ
jgi:hypothetical protein